MLYSGFVNYYCRCFDHPVVVVSVVVLCSTVDVSGVVLSSAVYAAGVVSSSIVFHRDYGKTMEKTTMENGRRGICRLRKMFRLCQGMICCISTSCTLTSVDHLAANMFWCEDAINGVIKYFVHVINKDKASIPYGRKEN